MHKLRSSDIDPEVRQLVRTLQDSATSSSYLTAAGWIMRNEEDDDIRLLMKACGISGSVMGRHLNGGHQK
jgi:hypothetical protein